MHAEKGWKEKKTKSFASEDPMRACLSPRALQYGNKRKGMTGRDRDKLFQQQEKERVLAKVRVMPLSVDDWPRI